MRTDATPFIVGQIRRVSFALHSAERRPPEHPLSTFQTVSLETVRKVIRATLRPWFWPLYGGQTGQKVVRFMCLQRSLAGTLEPFLTVSLGTWVNKGTTKRKGRA